MLGLAVVPVADASWQPDGPIDGAAQAERPAVAAGADGLAVAAWRKLEGRQGFLCCHAIQVAIRQPGANEFGPPETLAAPSAVNDAPQVLLDESGNATVVWIGLDGPEVPAGAPAVGEAGPYFRDDGSHFRVMAAMRPAGESFGPVQILSPAGIHSAPAEAVLGADGRVAIAWNQGGRAGGIGVTSGSAKHGFGAPGLIPGTGSGDGRLSLDVGPDDELAVAWVNTVADVERQTLSSSVRVSVRPAGGAFSEPRTIADAAGPIGELDLALGERGEATIAWGQSDQVCLYCLGGAVMAISRSADGAYGTPVELAPSDRAPGGIQAAINPAGEAIVAWASASAARLPGPTDISRIRAAVKAPGGSFGSPQTLSVSCSHATQLRVGQGAKGRLALVWLASARGQVRPEVVTRDPGRTFGPRRALSAPGPLMSDPAVSVSADGEATAAWAVPAGSEPSRIDTATLVPGGDTTPVVDLCA